MRIGISIIEFMIAFLILILGLLPILSAVHVLRNPNLKREPYYYTCDHCSQKTTDTVDVMIYESFSRRHFMICHPCYAPVEKALAK